MLTFRAALTQLPIQRALVSLCVCCIENVYYSLLEMPVLITIVYKVLKPKSLYLAQAFPTLHCSASCTQLHAEHIPLDGPQALQCDQNNWSSYSPPQLKSDLPPLFPISLGGSTIYPVLLTPEYFPNLRFCVAMSTSPSVSFPLLD